MMMQIHSDAIRNSRSGGTQYIVCKGAYYTLCKRNRELLSLLREGYELHRKYVNGVGEYCLRIEEDTPNGLVVRQALSSLLFGQPDSITGSPVIIHVQEFFNEAATEQECILMYITEWKNNAPGTFWVTPKDRIADPEAFADGQKKAEKILDIAQVFRVKPYSGFLRRELEQDKKRGCLY